MTNKQKRQKEIAIIFEKEIIPNKIVIQKPKKILLGYLNEDNLFVTKRGNYHYIADLNYKYGFAMRQTFKQFKEFLQSTKETINEDIQLYLESLQEYYFFFTATDQQNFSDLALLTTPIEAIKNSSNETEELETYIIPEIDIKIGQEILKQKAKENNLNQKTTTTTTKEFKIDFDPKKLSDDIKSVVIGQDEQIDDIITIIWQNCKSNTKNNILLIGPTGTGKTEIMRNISKSLGLPMAVLNVTDVSQSAYQGANLSQAVSQLVKNADNDIEKASHGIIFIDEIDKKAGNGEYNTGVMTTGIQDELLKLLEDNDYQVNISDNPMYQEMVTINTKNITFICAGAFSKMEQVKKESIKKSSGFGFGANVVTTTPTEISKTITPDDLTKYGLKPELIGRLHNIIQLSPLTKDNLISIMKNPNNKTIQEKRNLLESLGIKLNLEEEVYSYIADTAIKKNTGARGITGEVDRLFLKAMKEISQSNDKENLSELIINKDTILDHRAYKLIRKK